MKKTMLVSCALAALAMGANAALYDWYSDGSLGDDDPGYDLNSVSGKPAKVGDYVALYKATESRAAGSSWYKNLIVKEDFTIGGSHAGDTKVADTELSKWRTVILFEELGTVDLDDGSHYYTVIFDTPVAGVMAGSQYIVMDKSTVLAENDGGDRDIICFDFTGNYSGIQWNTVQTVPEPSTIGLLGISGLGLLLVRRKKYRRFQ